jgi:hypothetical protein
MGHRIFGFGHRVVPFPLRTLLAGHELDPQRGMISDRDEVLSLTGEPCQVCVGSW